MTPQAFIAKWKRASLSERSGSQQHFLDLCEVLGQATPATADPDGAWYTFDRGVSKTGGGDGWADVWMQGHFGWEYKRKHKDLNAAYQQLLQYREALENPPLLVVCDLDRFEVHTNFTNTPKTVYTFSLAELGEPKNIDILRSLFLDPGRLKPAQTVQEITEELAGRFAVLADGMRDREIPAQQAAHFLMKLMFCMFAEDIGLLPEKVFSKILTGSKINPGALSRRLRGLFEAMARGGEFGADPIKWFNGGLFSDFDVVDLTLEEIEELIHVNDCDWSNVEPSIFGTLFERTLDPDKRSQIGAHYTSREDIETLLEPVLMAPLRREWGEVKAEADKLWPRVQEAARKQAGSLRKVKSKARQEHDAVLRGFLHRLAEVKILDPACGSGNFLYVAIKMLLDLEKQVISYASQRDVPFFPQVRPTQLSGIEINPYAQELAQVVIWIGFLQWMHHNGYLPPEDPILSPMESIRNMDAVIDPETLREPEWPAADFIVGNPPFLGGKLLRMNLGDEYLDGVYGVWDGRVPRQADLCCYWFEKARAQIENGKCKRAGLLATQGIRGGVNREILKRIKKDGDIFFAVSDRDWILDGANVHVSMIGFDDGSDERRMLDGQPVQAINANLTSSVDLTEAKRLPSNAGVCFQGPVIVGPFDVPLETAIQFLLAPNPHGRPNSDVLTPVVNAADITGRTRDWFIIDFGERTQDDAARYELPFSHVKQHVKPLRATNKDRQRRENWWRHGRAGTDIKEASASLSRTLVTPRVSKHRLFAWMSRETVVTDAVVVFASEGDYFFGVLHYRAHELWARAQGTQLRERESGFRYTPTTCFDTFPFPCPTEEQAQAITTAAQELDALRNRWLNPPEWTCVPNVEFPGSVNGPWARYLHDPDLHGIGTVRYPRIIARESQEEDEEGYAAKLKRRTLTNLYNERPTWLDMAHRKLDALVLEAYGWAPGASDEEIIAGLLELNRGRESV